MDMQIANRLFSLRKEHGLTQEELAEKLGISRQAISKWERGESSPDTDNLIALSKLYETTIDEILNLNIEVNEDFIEQDDFLFEDYEDWENYEYNDDGEDVYSLIITIIFFVLGFTTGRWYILWLLFLTIPLYKKIIKPLLFKD